jgi:hypothetical protein
MILVLLCNCYLFIFTFIVLLIPRTVGPFPHCSQKRCCIIFFIFLEAVTGRHSTCHFPPEYSREKMYFLLTFTGLQNLCLWCTFSLNFGCTVLSGSDLITRKVLKKDRKVLKKQKQRMKKAMTNTQNCVQDDTAVVVNNNDTTMVTASNLNASISAIRQVLRTLYPCQTPI